MTKTLLLLFTFFSTSSTWAFPGMIRQGYVNCTSCHLSPAGGGVLTEYGRELSGDVLSTWTKDKEGHFAYDALINHLPKNVFLGGDTRIMQSYQSTGLATEKRFFLMQSDLEGAYHYQKFTFDLELGYLDSNEFNSLRHYVLFQSTEWDAFRFGKFKNNYGINTDEHNLTIKSNLGWNEESETYNLEYSRLTEDYGLFATAILGAPETVSTDEGLSIGRSGIVDRGVSVRASKYLGDSYEVGASYFYGKKMGAAWRSVMGPFVILGFSHRFFYLGELDFQKQKKSGVFNYQRLTYEPLQGLQIFITQELAESDWSNTNTRTLRYGLGLQFFPRPHYEFDLRWNIEKDPSDENKFNPLAWLLFHFYL